MSTIINQKGQLYELVAKRDRDYDECQLIEDAPVLRFNKHVDCRIAITEGGRLYDIQEMEYLNTNISNFSSLYSTGRDNFLALTENGHLIYIQQEGRWTGDGIGFASYAITGYRLEGWASNIRFVTVTLDMEDYIFVDNENQWFSHKSGRIQQDNLPRIDEIIKANDGCMTTNSHLYLFPGRLRPGHLPIISIKLMGKYLFSGICRGDEVFNSLACIEMDEDGRLLTGMHQENRRRNVWNQLIEDMHQSSPWMGFIRYNSYCALYNKNGYSYFIGKSLALNNTKIPPHILVTSVRLKNPMTKI